MLSWMAGQVLDHNMRRLNAGDPGPTLRLDAEDVVFEFPGDSSWSGGFRGKRELRSWLERFAEWGCRSTPTRSWSRASRGTRPCACEVTTTSTRPTGERVYENRYVIWGRMSWGLMREYEVYEDTQKAKELDGWLADHERRRRPR